MKTGITWTNTEVDLIVADYFAMLEIELIGKTLNKKDHRTLKGLLVHVFGKLAAAFIYFVFNP